MKATVQWKENMVFVGMPDSGFPVQIDSDSTYGGTNSGVRPMEMIALGLAGCTAVDVLTILQKKRQQVTQFEVKIDAPRSPEYPKVFTSALITYMNRRCCDPSNYRQQSIARRSSCWRRHFLWNCGMRFTKTGGMGTGV
jgi:putative redox protein